MHIYLYMYFPGLGIGFPKNSPLVEPFDMAIEHAFLIGAIVKYYDMYELRKADFKCMEPDYRFVYVCVCALCVYVRIMRCSFVWCS